MSRVEPVLIVGAGPAGATAALRLAQAGVAVRLLDRAPFPRNKPCGGGISVRVLRRFPYLARALSRIATHEISRLYLEGPAGESTIVESDTPAALMVRRVEFDALLVSLAVEAGAQLATGVDVVQVRVADHGLVTLTARDGRQFESTTVIAADGVHSVVARRLGLNKGWPSKAVALDMMEETPRAALRDVDPSTLWVAYGFKPAKCSTAESAARAENPERTLFSALSARSPVKRDTAPEGYAYIFPKRDHVNIGLGYVLSYFREEVDRAPYELQRDLVSRLRARGVVVGASVRDNFTPFLIPIGGPLPRPGRGRVLLAGDAGGFVNGFTAEGIYYAMVSGDLAARTIVASFGSLGSLPPGRSQTADLARPYQRAINREIGAELRDSVLIQRYLFGDRRRIAAAIAEAPRQAAITKLILDLIIGRRSYRDVRRRMFARAPLLASKLVWGLLESRLESGN
jgi:flavin-dependent dehydrogenase